jgi:hypothetical protein
MTHARVSRLPHSAQTPRSVRKRLGRIFPAPGLDVASTVPCAIHEKANLEVVPPERDR